VIQVLSSGDNLTAMLIWKAMIADQFEAFVFDEWHAGDALLYKFNMQDILIGSSSRKLRAVQ
jgi:hypothetical protein